MEVVSPNTATRHERPDLESIMQHVQPDPQADPETGVRGAGQEDRGRIRGQGAAELGAVRGDAVLPARASALAARDRGKLEELRRQARAPWDRGPGTRQDDVNL